MTPLGSQHIVKNIDRNKLYNILICRKKFKISTGWIWFQVWTRECILQSLVWTLNLQCSKQNRIYSDSATKPVRNAASKFYHCTQGRRRSKHGLFAAPQFFVIDEQFMSVFAALRHVYCIGQDWKLVCQKLFSASLLALVCEYFGSDLDIKSLTMQLDMLYNL